MDDQPDPILAFCRMILADERAYETPLAGYCQSLLDERDRLDAVLSAVATDEANGLLSETEAADNRAAAKAEYVLRNDDLRRKFMGLLG